MELFKGTMILDKLSKSKFPPGHTVFLRSMKSLLLSYPVPIHFASDLDNLASSVDGLLEVTASTLDDRALQQLFVTSQLSNLKLSVRHSFEYIDMYAKISPLMQPHKLFTNLPK